MKQKRYCDECGNVCEESRCPICGRKTRVYHEANKTSITAKKTDWQYSEQNVEKKEKKKIQLPKQEFTRTNKPSFDINKVWKILGVIIGVILVVMPLLTSFFEDDTDDYVDYSYEEPIKGNINRTITSEDISIQCELDEEEYDPGVQKIMLTNTSDYIIDVALVENDTPLVYYTLPAHAEFEELVFDEKLSVCDAQTDLAYEMSEKPSVQTYVLKKEITDFDDLYTLTLNEQIDEEQMEQLMQFLYSQLYYKYESYINLEVFIQEEHQFDAEFDFYEGTIIFTNVVVENVPEDIFI